MADAYRTPNRAGDPKLEDFDGSFGALGKTGLGFQIADNGEWIDNVYNVSKPNSIMGWLRRRRDWSPSSDRSTFTSADILQHGYLEKQGSWRKNWKSRYFILRSDTHSLCYFNNHVDMVLLGEVVVGASAEVWRGMTPPTPSSSSDRPTAGGQPTTSSNNPPVVTRRSITSLPPSPSPSPSSSSANSSRPPSLPPTLSATSSLSSASVGGPNTLSFGVKCSTTSHVLIMEAPDAVSLGNWVQTIQEEISSAQAALLHSSTSHQFKGGGAGGGVPGGAIESLLSTFAGAEIPSYDSEYLSLFDLPRLLPGEGIEEDVPLVGRRGVYDARSTGGAGLVLAFGEDGGGASGLQQSSVDGNEQEEGGGGGAGGASTPSSGTTVLVDSDRALERVLGTPRRGSGAEKEGGGAGTPSKTGGGTFFSRIFSSKAAQDAEYQQRPPPPPPLPPSLSRNNSLTGTNLTVLKKNGGAATAADAAAAAAATTTDSAVQVPLTPIAGGGSRPPSIRSNFDGGVGDVTDDEDEFEMRAERNVAASFSPRFGNLKVGSLSAQKQSSAEFAVRSPSPQLPLTPGLSPQFSKGASAAVGLQLSVQLSGVCDLGDSLFVVAFGGRFTAAANGSGGANNNFGPAGGDGGEDARSGDGDGAGLEWVLAGRTEVVKQRDAGAIISRAVSTSRQAPGLAGGPQLSSALVCRQFSTMIDDPSRFDLLMFSVYKAKSDVDDLNQHQELAWGVAEYRHVVPDEFVRLMLNVTRRRDSMAAFQEMNADLNLRLPSEVFLQPDSFAYIGICATRSVPLTRRSQASAQKLNFRSPPYSSKTYSFQSLNGQVLTKEEIYVPTYSLSVPAAMLALLLEERLPSVDMLLKVVREELDAAVKHRDDVRGKGAGGERPDTGKRQASLKKLSSFRKQESTSGFLASALLADGTSETDAILDLLDDQIAYVGSIASEVAAADSKVETLRRGEDVLKEVQNSLLGDYRGCLNTCVKYIRSERDQIPGSPLSPARLSKAASLLEEQTAVVTGVPVELGGARLKRSVMKKSKLHAFIPTNLNVQLMHIENVRDRSNNSDGGGGGSTADGAGGKDVPAADSTGAERDFRAKSLDSAAMFEGEGNSAQFPSEQKQLDSFVTMTFGVPSAHSLGSHHGGLRRQLLSQATDGVFKANEAAWNTGRKPLPTSNTENRDDESSATTRAAQVCALHARGLEMTVADLQVHAQSHSNPGGIRRRGSILEVAVVATKAGDDTFSSVAARAAVSSEASSLAESLKAASVTAAGPSTPTAAASSNPSTPKLTGDVDDWQKCAQLMHRVDIVTSQMLSIAMTSIQATVAMAAAGSPNHIVMLPRILEIGYLVSVESLLSAYGGELCMLEDLAVAIEWLSTVTVRFVERRQGPRKDTESGGGSADDGEVDPENPKGYGYADGVWIRRRLTEQEYSSSSTGIAGIKWGELIVDLEVEAGVAAAIREAKGKVLDLRKDSVGASNKSWTMLGGRRGSSPSVVGDQSSGVAPTSAAASPAKEQQYSYANVTDKMRTDSMKGAVRFPWGPGVDMAVIATVKLSAVLFTQGINAQQTLANAKIGGDAGIQVSINRSSLRVLKDYTYKYKQFLSQSCRGGRSSTSAAEQACGGGLGATGAQGSAARVYVARTGSDIVGGGDCSRPSAVASVEDEIATLDALLSAAETTVNDSCVFGHEKNVNVLLKTSDLCRFMNGAHSVMCKSGKDRSSMAITLEQSRYLCSHHGVVSGKKSVEIMRKHGVRRHNVWANTGQRDFAFNGINYTSLPRCYRPPNGSYSGSVHT